MAHFGRNGYCSGILYLRIAFLPYNHRHSFRLSIIQIRNFFIMAFWDSSHRRKGFNRLYYSLYEHTMDYIGLVGDCANAPIFWIYTLYYDNRHTFRDAAFQDGRTIIAAFWQDVQIVNAMSK